MSQETEKYTVELEVDESKVDAGVASADKKLENFKKRSEKARRLAITLTISELEKKVADARKKLAEFKKSGDKEGEIKARFNIQNLQRNLTIARKDLRDTIKAAGAGEYAKLSAQLNSTRNAYKNLAAAGKENTKEARALLKEVNALDKRLKKIDSSVGQNQRNVGNYGSALASLKGKILGVAGALGLLKLATDVIASTFKASFAFEQQRIEFETLFDTVEEGQQMLSNLTEFAKVTPFTIPGIREAALKLKAYGVATENIIPTMKVFGNISRGNQDIFNRLTYAYGQVTAAGKLYGTELRQFTEAGIPLIEALADHFGVASGEIRKMTEEGKISSKDVTIALENMQKEGGKFADLMEKQSQTAVGAWSNIKDSVIQAQEQFAKTKAYEKLVEALNWVAGNLGILAHNFLAFFQNLAGITAIGTVKIYDFFRLSFSKIGGELSFFFQEIVAGLKVVPDNFGIAFKNIAPLVKRGLNSAFEVVQNFYNRAIEMLNNLPGIEFDPATGKLFSDDETALEEFKSFQDANLEQAKDAWRKSHELDKRESQKRVDNIIEYGLEEMQALKSLDEIRAERRAKNEAIAGDINLDLLGGGGGSGGSTGGGAAAKQAEEVEEAKKKVEEYSEKFEDLTDKIEEATEKTNEFYEGIKDSIDEARDAQAQLRAELEDFNREQNLGAAGKIGERDLRLAKDEEAVQKQISELKAEDEGAAERKIELENELLTIQKERKLIQDYINAASDEEKATLEERQRYLGLSETEQILEDLKAKKDAKKAEIDAEIAKQERIVELNLRFLEITSSREREDLVARKILAKEYSKGVLADQEKINEQFEKLGLDDLTREEQLQFQKQLLTSETLEREARQLENQQQTLLETRESYNQLIETAFNESVDRQKVKMNELIAVIKRAQQEQIRLNALRSAASSSSSTTNNNVNVTQNISNSADATAAVNAIVRKVK